MSDDFGTVNVSRAERAREIDAMRQQYQRHRTALERMIADAPTEHLAAGYRQLIADIDGSLAKLNDLEGAAPATPATPTPAQRDLVTAPMGIDDGEEQRDSRSRLALIVVAALIALGAIGWLIWKASSDRAKPGTVVEQPVPTTAAPSTISEAQPATPAVVADVLTVNPPSTDYGVIRKGTRATRQFEISNTSDQPVTIQVARSACRCLYYEYRDLIPPKGKETVTVTIDGARAKAGSLRESVKVTGKKDPSIAATLNVSATIR